MAPRPRAPPPPAAPPAVDVSGLFASIAAAGLLPGGGAPPPAAPPPPPPRAPPPPPPPPRVPAGGGAHTADAAQHAMVFKMYDARPLVCKASALRFEAGDEEGLRKHMDYLFRRNRRGKVKGGAPPSRRWFQGVDSWVSLIERFDREDDEHVVSVFDAAGPPGGKADDEVEGGGGGGDGGAAVEKPVMKAPAGCTRLECFQCGEEIPLFWDETNEEWMLRDAVNAPDGSGRICHSACGGASG